MLYLTVQTRKKTFLHIHRQWSVEKTENETKEREKKSHPSQLHSYWLWEESDGKWVTFRGRRIPRAHPHRSSGTAGRTVTDGTVSDFQKE